MTRRGPAEQNEVILFVQLLPTEDVWFMLKSLRAERFFF